ncbi:LysR family transcriptional regulator [Stigmatella sp. ncwal1]|uniref:LysR family transcriptional regulator n=1 Tax=Stigmatella ashevillensis TaxID=2995309 RepID=A0ABT5DJL9_9BACT|nr:LysR family transcriptional regulator [Stigmatella ashevillena]MDC0713849.1 LysR family transcriptional regulator [Stigmatella ashevillena]
MSWHISHWDDLRIFMAVAETGSLSAAARHLRLSQPTVGRRLRALEKGAGLRLFDRVSNRLELTEAGREVERVAAPMRSAADAVERRLGGLKAGEREPVRITATGSVAFFLTRFLPELMEETEGIPIALSSSKEPLNLARREADVALRMSRLPVDGDLVSRKLAKLRFSIYGPAKTPARMSIIGLPKTERRPSQSGFLDDWAAGRPILLRLSDVFLRYQAVRFGRGVSLLPCWLGDGDPELVRLIPPPPELAEEVYCLYHGDNRGFAPVVSVCQALGEIFKRHASLLAGEGHEARRRPKTSPDAGRPKTRT